MNYKETSPLELFQNSIIEHLGDFPSQKVVGKLSKALENGVEAYLEIFLIEYLKNRDSINSKLLEETSVLENIINFLKYFYSENCVDTLPPISAYSSIRHLPYLHNKNIEIALYLISVYLQSDNRSELIEKYIDPYIVEVLLFFAHCNGLEEGCLALSSLKLISYDLMNEIDEKFDYIKRLAIMFKFPNGKKKMSYVLDALIPFIKNDDLEKYPRKKRIVGDVLSEYYKMDDNIKISALTLVSEFIASSNKAIKHLFSCGIGDIVLNEIDTRNVEISKKNLYILEQFLISQHPEHSEFFINNELTYKKILRLIQSNHSQVRENGFILVANIIQLGKRDAIEKLSEFNIPQTILQINYNSMSSVEKDVCCSIISSLLSLNDEAITTYILETNCVEVMLSNLMYISENTCSNFLEAFFPILSTHFSQKIVEKIGVSTLFEILDDVEDLNDNNNHISEICESIRDLLKFGYQTE